MSGYSVGQGRPRRLRRITLIQKRLVLGRLLNLRLVKFTDLVQGLVVLLRAGDNTFAAATDNSHRLRAFAHSLRFCDRLGFCLRHAFGGLSCQGLLVSLQGFASSEIAGDSQRKG